MVDNKYIKSYSNYIFKKKKQNINNGYVYERDMTTIGGLNQFAPGQIPLYKSSNFLITINNDRVPNKKIENDKFDNWTLDSIINDESNDNEEDTLKVVIKQNYYKLKDFAYYGSCSELLRTSIINIADNFPGELYVPEINDNGKMVGIPIYYFSNNSNDPILLGGDKNLVLVDNPSKIDIYSLNVNHNEIENPLKYLCNEGYKNYGLTNDENKKEWVVKHEKKQCFNVGDLMATVTFYPKEEKEINIYVYKLQDNNVVYLTEEKNLGWHLRPIQSVYNDFYNSLGYFEKILFNKDTIPQYTATFEVIDENKYGYVKSLKKFTFPKTYGGYNICTEGNKYDNYVKELSYYANFYDEMYCDNLYRSMTHESIKNFDWTFTRYYTEGDEDEYVLGGGKLQKFIRLIGREFDEIKLYIDSIRNYNFISYNENNLMPDYFLTSNLESKGWVIKAIFPFDDKLNTITKLSEKISPFYYENDNLNSFNLKLNDCNILVPVVSSYWSDEKFSFKEINYEFLKNLNLNSRNILRKKGTIDGIESLLSLFNLKSKQMRIIKLYAEKIIDEKNKKEYFIRTLYLNNLKSKGKINFKFDKKFDGFNLVIKYDGGTIKNENWKINKIENYIIQIDVDNEIISEILDDSYDYSISENVAIATTFIPDTIPSTDEKFHNLNVDKPLIDWINTTQNIAYNTEEFRNGEYVPYQGLPLRGYIKYYLPNESDKNENGGYDEKYKLVDISNFSSFELDKIIKCEKEDLGYSKDKTVYLFPYFTYNKIIDGNPYYQMKGGWLNKSHQNNIVDNSFMYFKHGAFTETKTSIEKVKTINDLIKIPIQNLHKDDIYYVENVNEDYLLLDGYAYEIIPIENNDKVYGYIITNVEDGLVTLGDVIFEDNISYYNFNGDETYVNLSEYNKDEIKLYIKKEKTTVDNKETIKRDFILNSVNEEDNDKAIETIEFLNSNKKSNYFILNNVYSKNKINKYGWNQLSENDEKLNYVKTIKDIAYGNNPHNGKLKYDMGDEYLSYFKQLFKHSINNNLFNQNCYLSNYYNALKDIKNKGFNIEIENDKKIHSFIGKIYSNKSKNYKNDYIDTLKYYGIKNNLNGNNDILTDGYNDLAITDNIINIKNIDIKFTNKINDKNDENGKDYEIKYLDNVVMNYVEQLLPSTIISNVNYLNKEKEKIDYSNAILVVEPVPITEEERKKGKFDFEACEIPHLNKVYLSGVTGMPNDNDIDENIEYTVSCSSPEPNFEKEPKSGITFTVKYVGNKNVQNKTGIFSGYIQAPGCEIPDSSTGFDYRLVCDLNNKKQHYKIYSTPRDTIYSISNDGKESLVSGETPIFNIDKCDTSISEYMKIWGQYKNNQKFSISSGGTIEIGKPKVSTASKDEWVYTSEKPLTKEYYDVFNNDFNINNSNSAHTIDNPNPIIISGENEFVNNYIRISPNINIIQQQGPCLSATFDYQGAYVKITQNELIPCCLSSITQSNSSITINESSDTQDKSNIIKDYLNKFCEENVVVSIENIIKHNLDGSSDIISSKNISIPYVYNEENTNGATNNEENDSSKPSTYWSLSNGEIDKLANEIINNESINEYTYGITVHAYVKLSDIEMNNNNIIREFKLEKAKLKQEAGPCTQSSGTSYDYSKASLAIECNAIDACGTNFKLKQDSSFIIKVKAINVIKIENGDIIEGIEQIIYNQHSTDDKLNKIDNISSNNFKYYLDDKEVLEYNSKFKNRNETELKNETNEVKNYKLTVTSGNAENNKEMISGGTMVNQSADCVCIADYIGCYNKNNDIFSQIAFPYTEVKEPLKIEKNGDVTVYVIIAASSECGKTSEINFKLTNSNFESDNFKAKYDKDATTIVQKMDDYNKNWFGYLGSITFDNNGIIENDKQLLENEITDFSVIISNNTSLYYNFSIKKWIDKKSTYILTEMKINGNKWTQNFNTRIVNLKSNETDVIIGELKIQEIPYGEQQPKQELIPLKETEDYDIYRTTITKNDGCCPKNYNFLIKFKDNNYPISNFEDITIQIEQEAKEVSNEPKLVGIDGKPILEKTVEWTDEIISVVDKNILCIDNYDKFAKIVIQKCNDCKIEYVNAKAEDFTLSIKEGENGDLIPFNNYNNYCFGENTSYTDNRIFYLYLNNNDNYSLKIIQKVHEPEIIELNYQDIKYIKSKETSNEYMMYSTIKVITNNFGIKIEYRDTETQKLETQSGQEVKFLREIRTLNSTQTKNKLEYQEIYNQDFEKIYVINGESPITSGSLSADGKYKIISTMSIIEVIDKPTLINVTEIITHNGGIEQLDTLDLVDYKVDNMELFRIEAQIATCFESDLKVDYSSYEGNSLDYTIDNREDKTNNITSSINMVKIFYKDKLIYEINYQIKTCEDIKNISVNNIFTKRFEKDVIIDSKWYKLIFNQMHE